MSRLSQDIERLTKCSDTFERLDDMIDNCEEIFYQITRPPRWENVEIAGKYLDMVFEMTRWVHKLADFISEVIADQAMMEFSLLRITQG